MPTFPGWEARRPFQAHDGWLPVVGCATIRVGAGTGDKDWPVDPVEPPDQKAAGDLTRSGRFVAGLVGDAHAPGPLGDADELAIVRGAGPSVLCVAGGSWPGDRGRGCELRSQSLKGQKCSSLAISLFVSLRANRL